MIRAPRRLLPDSSSPPIHRRRLPLPPLFRRRLSPLQASLVQALLCSGPIRGGRGLTPLGLLMDPAADGEGGGYEDASEFADAETGGGEVVRGEGEGERERKELPEELAKGVVCLECETSPEAEAAGAGGTCRVYVVGTAHVSQVNWPPRQLDI